MSNFTLMASNFMEVVEMFELHRQSAFRAAVGAIDDQAKRADFYRARLEVIQREMSPGGRKRLLVDEALAEAEIRFPGRWDEETKRGLELDFDMARQCRVCGCSSLTSCTAEGKPMCTWVGLDLCSNCETEEKADSGSEADFKGWEEPGVSQVQMPDGTIVTKDHRDGTATTEEGCLLFDDDPE